MDLRSDLPFWVVRNGLSQSFEALNEDSKCDALILGGGISGALLAHRLSKHGVDCVVIDRREIGFGSTSASTALLQHEIDTPLFKLSDKVGASVAQQAYHLGLESIANLKKLAGSDCGFAMRPSIRLAHKRSEVQELYCEYQVRKRARLPVSWCEEADLHQAGMKASAGLRTPIAAEVDPFRLTQRLMRLAVKNGARVFGRTTALRYEDHRRGVTVHTDRNTRIQCRRIFFATGYETRDILPPGLVNLKSTYAFVSTPVADLSFWKDRTLLWSMGDPYFYLRTTSDKRILVGGEDDGILDPVRRDKQIPAKVKRLVKRFNSVFPQASIEPAFEWAGIFGDTKDGMAYIGEHPSFPKAYFALGFGGNGITYAEMASGILTDQFLGRANPHSRLFAFDR
jgi:glycine/D-amino acid oxidase-like deaminating enzyme